MKLQKIVDWMDIKDQLAEELHKPVIKNFKRRKDFVRFKENISAAYLAQIESLTSSNKNVKYL